LRPIQIKPFLFNVLTEQFVKSLIRSIGFYKPNGSNRFFIGLVQEGIGVIFERLTTLFSDRSNRQRKRLINLVIKTLDAIAAKF
jgi:hypothetical protein